jgi:hypothetical protein
MRQIPMRRFLPVNDSPRDCIAIWLSPRVPIRAHHLEK